MNIAYICDRKKDCNTSSSCGKECIRTSDRDHAKYWYMMLPDIEDLRLYFDVSGSGTNEKWIEKSSTESHEIEKSTRPIIEGGTENGRK